MHLICCIIAYHHINVMNYTDLALKYQLSKNIFLDSELFVVETGEWSARFLKRYGEVESFKCCTVVIKRYRELAPFHTQKSKNCVEDIEVIDRSCIR